MDLAALPDLVTTTVRRLPVTTALVVLCLVASALAPLWGGAEAVGFGLPSALAGRWWTFGVGALVTPSWALVPVLVGLVGTVSGLLEARVGSRRTAAVLVVTHLVGTLGAAGVLLAGRALPWPWAHALAGLTDTGASAAGFGALAVLAGTLRPPTRHLVVTGVGGYLAVMLLCSGLLWDLEHLLAFGAGLLLVPGRRLRPTVSSLSRLRGGTALLVVMTAVAGLVQSWFPGYGGALGAGHASAPHAPWVAAVVLVGALLLGDGLRRGARWAWRVAPLGAGAGLLAWPVVGWGAGTVTSLAAVLVLGVLHHRRSRPTAPGHDVPTDVRTPLLRHGGGNLGWQHTWAGHESWTSPDGLVTLGFRHSAGVAIVLADPIGPRFRWYAACRAFVEHCEQQGLVVAWYAVSAGFLRETGREDRAVRVGEDAVVDLRGLTLTGKAWQDVRTARNRAVKEGVTVRRLDAGDDRLVRQVTAISAAWAGDKPLPEMGFTLGGVREALDPQVRVHVAVDEAGEVHGVVSWLPVHRDGAVVGWTLDLMRRRPTGFRPVVELLIAHSLLELRDEGYETASLSVAPLARSGDPDGPVEQLLGRCGRLLEPAYGFASLLAFKRKFSPRLNPVHLAWESAVDLPRIAVAVGHAYLPALTAAEALRAVRTLVAGHREALSRARARRPRAARPPRSGRPPAGRPAPRPAACPTTTPSPTATRPRPPRSRSPRP